MMMPALLFLRRMLSPRAHLGVPCRCPFLPTFLHPPPLHRDTTWSVGRHAPSLVPLAGPPLPFFWGGGTSVSMPRLAVQCDAPLP